MTVIKRKKKSSQGPQPRSVLFKKNLKSAIISMKENSAVVEETD